MKNPVTFSVYEARSVQKKRQIRQIILLCGVVLVLLGGIFFLYVLMQKDKIDKAFPTGVTAAATSGTSLPGTDPSPTPTLAVIAETDGTSETIAATETTGESTSEETTQPPDATGESSDSSTETTVAPIAVPAIEFLIPENDALQTVSHKVRDAAFHKLQQKIQEYIDEQRDARIGFYYLNLQGGEAFGYNDMEPFVPAGAFSIPINLCLYETYTQGSALPTEIMTYTSADNAPGDSTIPSVKSYDLRTLCYLSMVEKDNTAIQMLLRRLGGIDLINSRLQTISNIIDYRTAVTYADYKGQMFSGRNRSSAQDMAKYMEAFYLAYMTDSVAYQPMFNDLCLSPDQWGVGSSFPSDVLVCHRTGSDAGLGCETDVALVFAQEPFILSVSAECADQDRAREIQSELGSMVYEYLLSCYS